MTALQWVVVGVIPVVAWLLWQALGLIPGIVDTLLDDPDEWEPVCEHAAPVYVRRAGLGLLCPLCLDTADRP